MDKTAKSTLTYSESSSTEEKVANQTIVLFEQDEATASALESALQAQAISVKRVNSLANLSDIDVLITDYHFFLSDIVYSCAALRALFPKVVVIAYNKTTKPPTSKQKLALWQPKIFIGLFLEKLDLMIFPIAVTSVLQFRQYPVAALPVTDLQLMQTETMELNLLHNQASRGGKVMKLRPAESRLLYVLMLHKGTPVVYSGIMNQIWSSGHYEITAVHRLAAKLRKKIEPDHKNPQYIITIPRVGYMFREPSD